MQRDGGLMKSEIKALGKLIIRELDLVDNSDVLNKWMITHIAEQMHRYESAKTEVEQLAAGERCSDTIIKFWKHRSYNTSWYPFSKYKELYDGLNSLLADEDGLELFDSLRDRFSNQKKIPEKLKMVKRVNKWLIVDMLENSYRDLDNTDDAEWKNLAKELDDGDDARILERVANAIKGNENMVREMLEIRIQSIEEIMQLYSELLEQEKIKINGL